MDKAKNLPVILPIELEFQGIKLSCPHENGHRMVPVRMEEEKHRIAEGA